MAAFQRYCRVTLGTSPMAIQIEGGSLASVDGTVQQGLRISFNIRKTVQIEFNSKILKIYNLSKDTRDRIKGVLGILVEAGYIDNYGTIFVGHSRVIDHYKEGADWVTEIQAGDGYQSVSKMAYKSWGKGTSLETVATHLAQQSGLGTGNLREMLRTASKDTLQQFAHGHTSQGGAIRQLDQLIRSCGLSWSIQDEQIQVIRQNTAVSAKAALVSPTTGLLGSPKHIAWKPNWPTYTSFKSLLNAALKCGYLAVLDSANISGRFMLMKVIHVGDTMGSSWYTECEGV